MRRFLLTIGLAVAAWGVAGPDAGASRCARTG